MKLLRYNDVTSCDGGPRHAHCGLVRHACRDHPTRVAGAWVHVGSRMYAVFIDHRKR